MKHTIKHNYSIKNKETLHESLHVSQSNMINSLLHPFNVIYSPGLNYNLKLHHAISTCFVLNLLGYGGHIINTNFPSMNLILGQYLNPGILNTITTQDEQESHVYTSTKEDHQITSSRNLQSTPKMIFKAICLLWSFPVSKSISDNLSYLAFFCLSTLTELTTNFGLGVLPLGLYMTPTRWGLPKPVPTRRNAWLAKTNQNLSYRPHIHMKENDDINENNKSIWKNKHKNYTLT